MCLLITVALAIVFSVLFFVSKRNDGTENSKSSGKKNFSQPLFTTMLSFWAATIMWSVDVKSKFWCSLGLPDKFIL